MPDWIRTKDHKPTTFMQVLIAHDNKYVDSGFRDNKGTWQAFSGEMGIIENSYHVKCQEILDGNVQYWMPLPTYEIKNNHLSETILEEFQKKLDRDFASKEFIDECVD